jgi:hypothetical protein
MPFTTHRGQRIHYTVEGSGPWSSYSMGCS